MNDNRQCPFCDYVADSTAAEVAHMETAHRDVVAQRLADAGFDAPTFEPASEVVQLRAENERLRAALEAAADALDEHGWTAAASAARNAAFSRNAS